MALSTTARMRPSLSWASFCSTALTTLIAHLPPPGFGWRRTARSGRARVRQHSEVWPTPVAAGSGAGLEQAEGEYVAGPEWSAHTPPRRSAGRERARGQPETRLPRPAGRAGRAPGSVA